MSGETEQTAETEAAEATATGQETAPSDNAEAADDFDTEWASMVAAETGETQAADDPENTEAETGTAEEPSGDEADAAGSEAAEEETADASETDDDTGTAEAAAETGEEPDGDAATVDWATLPAAARSAFEAEKARADRAEHSFKSRQGREAALQRRLDEYLAASGETPEQAEDRSPDTETEPAVSEEARQELAEFETEFPDIAKPILKHVVEPLSALVKSQAERINRLEAGLKTVGEDRMDQTIAEQEAIVRSDHADYDDIADTDEFVEWAKAQPDYVQKGVMANAEQIVDGASVSSILAKYKADKGIANGIANGHVNGNGAAAAAEETPGETEDAGESPPADRKPAADPTRSAQLRAARGNPAPSPGAPAREDDGNRTETEESVWAELRRDEERRLAAEARA